MNLDLIVTVDTALTHLAGALAIPVWVVLSAAADHRWQLDFADNPWYPTLRLFRQEVWGDNKTVFTSVAALEKAAIDYIDTRNQDARPFAWTADANTILGRVDKNRAASFSSRH